MLLDEEDTLPREYSSRISFKVYKMVNEAVSDVVCPIYIKLQEKFPNLIDEY